MGNMVLFHDNRDFSPHLITCKTNISVDTKVYQSTVLFYFRIHYSQYFELCVQYSSYNILHMRDKQILYNNFFIAVWRLEYSEYILFKRTLMVFSIYRLLGSIMYKLSPKIGVSTQPCYFNLDSSLEVVLEQKVLMKIRS